MKNSEHQYRRICIVIIICFFIVIPFLSSCGGGGGGGGSGDIDDTDTDISTAPDVPEIISPVNSTTINTDTLTISGTAEAGSTVELFDTNDTAPIGTAKADVNGDWRVGMEEAAYILEEIAELR